MKLLISKRGQSLVEYMVIVALMAIASMGVMRVLSQTTSGKLAQITHALQGGKSSTKIKFEKIEQSDIRKKDMSDFFQGSKSNKDR